VNRPKRLAARCRYRLQTPIRVSSAVHTAASIIIPITVVTTATSRHPRWTAIPARADTAFLSVMDVSVVCLITAK